MPGRLGAGRSAASWLSWACGSAPLACAAQAASAISRTPVSLPPSSSSPDVITRSGKLQPEPSGGECPGQLAQTRRLAPGGTAPDRRLGHGAPRRCRVRPTRDRRPGPARTPAARSRPGRPGRRPPGAGRSRAASARASARAVGRGRANDRADVGEAALADPVGARARRRSARAASLTVPPAASSRSCTSAAPGFEVADQHEQPGAGLARSVHERRSSESAPSRGLAVIASAPRPGTGPKAGSASHRGTPARRPRADVDIAALAVGDHEQTRVAGQRDDLLRARPSPVLRAARSRRAAA